MSRTARGGLIAALLLLIPLVVRTGGDGLREALDFTTGVLALVALTCSIVWGLVASDRIFLSTRHRLLAQAVHRATAVASVGFLLLHGTVKLALEHVSLLGALVPFSLGLSGPGALIGFGTLAGLLMVVTGVTGALRSAFASPARIAGRWRALHALAYPAWCAALVHGLYAGREPSGWVVALYCLCLVAVASALAVRSAPPPVKREVARRLLELLDQAPRGRRSARQDPPVRQTPLPGMEPRASQRQGPADIPVRPESAPFSALRRPEPRPSVGPAPGADMTAAYRALSSPTPSVTPRITPSARPESDTARAETHSESAEPDGTGTAPHLPPHPPQQDRPYGPPTSGEPWSKSGSIGGRP